MTATVAAVTGASRGIGRAIARQLSSTGTHVVALSRSTTGLAETRDVITDAGGSCTTIETDVTCFDQVRSAIAQIDETFGRLDILINNAGTAPMATMDSFEVGVFDHLVQVNVNAVFYVCRAAWPLMQRQDGGIIVNLSSLAAVDPFPGFQAYGATKAWVNTFTKALAAEGRAHGIRAFAVGPGAVDTTMLRQHFPDFPDDDALAPEDIAEAVAWILDDRSRHASGAAVYFSKT
jgi:3-oxoacyl-[acyl-carrier protein] reductase